MTVNGLNISLHRCVMENWSVAEMTLGKKRILGYVVK